ncbi:MAG: hypothetical protein ACREDR_17995 [Blastocatellia bacterium]
MRTAKLIKPFAASLIVAPLASILAWRFAGRAAGNSIVNILFAATVLVEVVALREAIKARRLFSKSDAGYLTWTLTVAFLIVRLVAEARLISLTFKLVQSPGDFATASSGLFFYIVVLRYLYTISDVLFIGAVLAAILSYKKTGLSFSIGILDYFYIVLVCAVPLTTYLYRGNLGLAGIIASDRYISDYRLIAVFVGGIIASLCLIIRRYALQMGGGTIARVWNNVAIAGIARDASFLVLAVLSNWWRPGAEFGEQYLLWVFSVLWLMAALYQQEAIAQASTASAVQPAPTSVGD